MLARWSPGMHRDMPVYLGEARVRVDGEALEVSLWVYDVVSGGRERKARFVRTRE